MCIRNFPSYKYVTYTHNIFTYYATAQISAARY